MEQTGCKAFDWFSFAYICNLWDVPPQSKEILAQSKDYAKQNIVYLRKNEQADLEQMGCKAFIWFLLQNKKTCIYLQEFKIQILWFWDNFYLKRRFFLKTVWIQLENNFENNWNLSWFTEIV